MGKRRKPPRKFYQLNQSPLFKCRSRARLASLLNSSLSDLETLANNDAQYHVFPVSKKGKTRYAQKPIGLRERVHERLFRFFRRISPPPYLHSGVPGRSNVTNAEEHVGPHPLYKIDIKSFYDNTTYGGVFQCFREQFQCSPDVAGLLSGLCTYNGHVPTGSSLSQALAFQVIKPVLDEFHAICLERDVVVTVYVDDVALSGTYASQHLLFKLKKHLLSLGYDCHKEAKFKAWQPKVVTGVIVTPEGIRVRNRQHQRIYNELYKLLGEDPDMDKVRKYVSLRGRIASGSQIDPSLKKHSEILENWWTGS